jgi:hypothetical protein
LPARVARELERLERTLDARRRARLGALDPKRLYGAIVIFTMRAIVRSFAERRGLSQVFTQARLFGSGALDSPEQARALEDLESMTVDVDGLVDARVLSTIDVGNVYETLIGHELELAASGEWRLVLGRGRKRSGSFYTPPALTDVVAEAALTPLLSDIATLEPDQRAAKLLGLSVCDPAMGAAAFLIEVGGKLCSALHAVWQELGLQRSSAEARTAIVRSVLHGVDSSRSAVAVAEAALWLFADSPELELHEAGRNLRHADALSGDSFLERPLVSQTSLKFARAATTESQPSRFDWQKQWPEIAERGGFDLVIGNPPWVAYAGRAAQPLADEQRDDYSRRFTSWRGYPTLHGLFIERAAEIAPRGVVALLVPSPVADLDGYRNVREALTRTHRPCEPLLEFGQDAFAGVTQPSFALLAVPDPTGSSHRAWTLVERQRLNGHAEQLSAPAVLELLVSAPRFPGELFREMGFQTTRLATLHLLCRSDHPEEGFRYPLLEGRDVREFRQGPVRLFLCDDPERVKWAGCRVRPQSEYARVCFVVRQTAKVPIAALHSGLPFRNTLLAGIAVDTLSPELLVGLLNSALYRALHLFAQRDARQAAFPQVKIRHLRSLPCPPDDRLAQQRVIDICRRASAAEMDRELREKLDHAVFELFGLPEDHRADVLKFVSTRAPELGHGAPVIPCPASSSLESVSRRIG